MLQTAKTSAVKARSQAINQLKAILVRSEPALRDSLTGLPNPRLIRRCAEFDPSAPSDPDSRPLYPSGPCPTHPEPHRRDRRPQQLSLIHI